MITDEAGGLLPMIPYFAMHDVQKALYISIGLAILVLISFGFLKARLFGATVAQSIRSAASTLLIGAAAAAASYGIVRGIDASSI
jgi:vacuolar iron transporter family protein